MKQAKTSKAWMRDHVNDFFVKQARKDGYRSRAAYKLLEIAEHDRLLKPGMIVVDLGATPGSWSQVVSSKVGAKGKVIALIFWRCCHYPVLSLFRMTLEESAVLGLKNA